MTKIKLAVIRSPSVRECPFGLLINISCKNAGDTVDRMEPLDNIDKDQVDQYIISNRRIYRHYQAGERCKYADKIIDMANAVHCDYGEAGEGIQDTPINPSPYYPRVWNGLDQSGLFSYPMEGYMDNSAAQGLFAGMFSMYAATGEVLLQKISNFEPDNNLVKIVLNNDDIE